MSKSLEERLSLAVIEDREVIAALQAHYVNLDDGR